MRYDLNKLKGDYNNNYPLYEDLEKEAGLILKSELDKHNKIKLHSCPSRIKSFKRIICTAQQ